MDKLLLNYESSFWSKVERKDETECWPWLASCATNGYGQFGTWNPRKSHRAHRLAWFYTFGEIPEGLCVLHRCDSKTCCNPSHLFLGTPADNTRDMINKNRQVYGDHRGEKGSLAKLTNKEVLRIRSMFDESPEGYGRVARIAEKFPHVSYSTIHLIVHRKTWKHI